MVMSRDQNAGHNHNIKTGSKPFEMVEEFKYLGATVTDRNSIHEETESRLQSRNACYRSVPEVFFSSLLSKDVKIKIQRTVILPVVLYGCDIWLDIGGGA
jgi:hypothetical protein